MDYFSACFNLVARALSQGRQILLAHSLPSRPVAAREGLSRDFLFILIVEFEKVTKPQLQPPHALKCRYCPSVQRPGELQRKMKQRGGWRTTPFPRRRKRVSVGHFGSKKLHILLQSNKRNGVCRHFDKTLLHGADSPPRTANRAAAVAILSLQLLKPLILPY